MNPDDSLATLAAEIAEWMARRTMRSGDDIPRIPRPPRWLPDFTEEAVAETLAEREAFARRLASLEVADHDVADQIDARLIGSILARCRWDLEILRSWENDAVFVFGQALGPWYDLLLPLPPLARERQLDLLHVATHIPSQLQIARTHLSRAGRQDTARACLHEIEGIGARFRASAAAAEALLDSDLAPALNEVADAAASALDEFEAWLGELAPTLPPVEAVGRDRFVWFLRNVALIANDPENLSRSAMQDYRRAVVAETAGTLHHRRQSLPPLAATIEDQQRAQARMEEEIRSFSVAEEILSHPDTLHRYLVQPFPDRLAPLRFLGVPDDLTDEHRVDDDAVAYAPEPAASMPYFYAANARDPRLGIIHEGAHHKQLASTWRHPNPLRRRYIDSVANEGIAHYNEEFMLWAGLFDDAPHSRDVIHNFARLRALRVVVDVNLATGVFTLDEAIEFFVRLVPMDHQTASEECAMYLATPGLAMSYHVGKQQMLELVTDAIVAQGQDFRFQDVHDRVWANGNAPFSLQRWEILGDRSTIDLVEAKAAALPPLA
ncbi:DUF885 family protein [Demequina sp. NBRC 110054]|uniref:DUF885 family protein n=1 Tax=Demequina sp. NBRC 110054 TaxID=1570343 RepID=UPI000A04656B|nr:DUF885 family protein [Demequina sp. NBRC 110054]